MEILTNCFMKSHRTKTSIIFALTSLLIDLVHTIHNRDYGRIGEFYIRPGMTKETKQRLITMKTIRWITYFQLRYLNLFSFVSFLQNIKRKKQSLDRNVSLFLNPLEFFYVFLWFMKLKWFYRSCFLAPVIQFIIQSAFNIKIDQTIKQTIKDFILSTAREQIFSKASEPKSWSNKILMTWFPFSILDILGFTLSFSPLKWL